MSLVRAFADAITDRDVEWALELCHAEVESFSLMAQLEASPYRGARGYSQLLQGCRRDLGATSTHYFPGGTANLEAACATDTNNSTGATCETEQVRSNLAAICLPPLPTQRPRPHPRQAETGNHRTPRLGTTEPTVETSTSLPRIHATRRRADATAAPVA
jgi:hypothetical protein